ncbi:MAG: hypothetical protein HUJ68_07715 [Clostridia bacterium]|nr:hypothetical protein [Clostridia bacterium]
MIVSIRNFKEYEFNGDINQIKEFIYPYNDFTIEEIINLVKENKDKSYVFDLTEIKNENSEIIKELKLLSSSFDNISFTGETYVENIPFFYKRGICDANNLEELKILCEKGISQVYIGSPLAFDLKNAKKITDKYNVKLRIIPNITNQGKFTLQHKSEGNNICSFFILPEHLHLYESYIDIIEFAGLNSKQPVFYEIYFQTKKWNDNLSIIIAGLGDIENHFPKEFTEFRLNCKKKCLVDQCHSCYKFLNLSNLVKENNLTIEKN